MYGVRASADFQRSIFCGYQAFRIAQESDAFYFSTLAICFGNGCRDLLSAQGEFVAHESFLFPYLPGWFVLSILQEAKYVFGWTTDGSFVSVRNDWALEKLGVLDDRFQDGLA